MAAWTAACAREFQDSSVAIGGLFPHVLASDSLWEWVWATARGSRRHPGSLLGQPRSGTEDVLAVRSSSKQLGRAEVKPPWFLLPAAQLGQREHHRWKGFESNNAALYNTAL